MSYTIAELDTAVEDTGWDYPYTPYTKPGEPKAEERIEHTQGWHEFQEVISDTTKYQVVDADYQGRKHENKTDGQWYGWVPLPNPGFTLPGIGRAVIVDEFGGEGQGDQYWLVFKVTEADGTERLFRRNGWYASYSGGEYDGPTEEVQPVQKTITVYTLKS